MKMYEIVVDSTDSYKYTILADTADDARAIALDKFENESLTGNFIRKVINTTALSSVPFDEGHDEEEDDEDEEYLTPEEMYLRDQIDEKFKEIDKLYDRLAGLKDEE